MSPAAQIVRLYREGKRRPEIAAELGVTPGQIAGALRRAGIRRKDAPPPAKRKIAPQKHRVESARAPKPAPKLQDAGEAPPASEPRSPGDLRLRGLVKARTAKIIAAAESALLDRRAA